MSINNRDLIKYFLVSAGSFFVGSVHGVLQMVPPIRAWLDSIGSPYGGPGHMIDPLAHAHINLIGGVTVLAMATTYYLLPRITEIDIYSKRLADQSFWWTTAGIVSFYTVLMVFGAWEGELLLAGSPSLEAVHAIYTPIVSVSATIMGIGLWLYLFNVIATIVRAYRRHDVSLRVPRKVS